MPATDTMFPYGINVNGDIRYTGSFVTKIPRSDLVQDSLAAYAIPWGSWRVWNAYQTVLPGTSASDDLGLYGGTFASASPSIQTYDVKNAGAVTLYARTMLWLPPEYDAAQTVTLRFYAGMLTTVASATATIDAECYKSDNAAGIGSDRVTTSATTINSLSLANKDFTVTSSGLSAGDILDLRVAIAINDSATATAVIGIIGAAYLLLDIRG